MRNILLIDNLDSFSFNLVDSFERLGCTVRTLRNTVDPQDAFALARDQNALIAISPGPGRPEESGCALSLIALARGKVPLLGICLGHQAIIQQAGGAIVRAPLPVHGKASRLIHDGTGPFAGIPSPVALGRYHSLGSADPPKRFHVHGIADGMAMAISDQAALQTGLQFHPESILTPLGDRILQNVIGSASRASPEKDG